MNGPEIEILYQDEALLVAYKPAGLLFHRHGWDRKGPFLLQTLRDQIGRPLFPVHRLDRPTAGLVLFALAPTSARHLALSFRNHRIRKSYWAICRGFAPQKALIDYPLKNPDNGVLQDAASLLLTQNRCELDIPSPPHPSSRYSLVMLRPFHGRTHQLRRHMAHLRHPIIGDVNHGDGRHNRLFRQHFDSNRLLLCALGLKFPHPLGGYLHIRAKADEAFRHLVKRLFPEAKTRPESFFAERVYAQQESGSTAVSDDGFGP